MHAFFPSCILINQVHKVFFTIIYLNIQILYDYIKYLSFYVYHVLIYPRVIAFFFFEKNGRIENFIIVNDLVHITERRLQTFFAHKNQHGINVRLSFIPNLPWLNPFSAEYWTIWRIACGYPVVIYCFGFPLGIKHISANNSHMYIRKTAIYIIQVYFNMISN